MDSVAVRTHSSLGQLCLAWVAGTRVRTHPLGCFPVDGDRDMKMNVQSLTQQADNGQGYQDESAVGPALGRTVREAALLG